MHKKTPFFCPVCKSPIKNSVSVNSYQKIGACELCETYIYYLNKDKWEAGWRPLEREARKMLLDRGLPILLIE
jgi:hypothetical protein